VIVALAVFFNWSYFRPREFYSDVNDQKKLSGELWEEQQKGAILDYLPRTALPPQLPSSGAPAVVKGAGEISELRKKSNYWEFDVLKGSGSWEIEVPVFNFPNWSTNHRWSTSEKGTILIEGGGPYGYDQQPVKIEGTFDNTSVRTLGNLVTLVCLGGIGILLKYGKNRKIFE
jgi:hypothetical protein